MITSLAFGVVVAMVSAAALPDPSDAAAQAARFYASQGITAPPNLHREALETFLAVEAAYKRKDYGAANRALEALWAKHPPGTDEWAAAYRQASDIRRAHGINIGAPPCYYALRMLTECVRWRMSSAGRRKPASSATLTVVLVGNAVGVQPTNIAEFERGQGQKVELTLDPLVSSSRSRVIKQSLWLFTEYIRAASAGALDVKAEILHLPKLTVPVAVTQNRGMRFAGLTGNAWRQIWAAIPDANRQRTDWWWLLYPSCVPEQYPDFERTEFITGGMGTGPDGMSPCFIIDDRWLTRKPPHLGRGPYTDIERRAYLPQWLQHEFFHHLFRIYPQFGLENKSHQWFDRTTWPADFAGRIEPDYYAEALNKRIQPKADPPLHVALKYTPPPMAMFRNVKITDLIGDYRHEPVQNDWHVGTLKSETVNGKPALRWTNKAGTSWVLTPDFAHGLLMTGPDCPYYDADQPDAAPFRILLKRDHNGRWSPKVSGFVFNGAEYLRTAGR